MLKLYSLFASQHTRHSKAVRLQLQLQLQLRLLYAVRHKPNKNIFSVKLPDDSQAILRYTVNGKILDMRAINVPSKHKGQGIARLLVEAAFTYALLNDYYLYLTCKYAQNYYRAVKNADFEERVVGPANILDGPESDALDPDVIHELPDPEDFM